VRLAAPPTRTAAGGGTATRFVADRGLGGNLGSRFIIGVLSPYVGQVAQRIAEATRSPTWPIPASLPSSPSSPLLVCARQLVPLPPSLRPPHICLAAVLLPPSASSVCLPCFAAASVLARRIPSGGRSSLAPLPEL